MRETTVSGRLLKYVREIVGWTAQDVITIWERRDVGRQVYTVRGLYQMEQKSKPVPVKYLVALQEEIGKEEWTDVIKRAQEVYNRKRGITSTDDAN